MFEPDRADRLAADLRDERGCIADQPCSGARYGSAVDELVTREILDDSSPVELLSGDGAAVLMHLRG